MPACHYRLFLALGFKRVSKSAFHHSHTRCLMVSESASRRLLTGSSMITQFLTSTPSAKKQ